MGGLGVGQGRGRLFGACCAGELRAPAHPKTRKPENPKNTHPHSTRIPISWLKQNRCSPAEFKNQIAESSRLASVGALQRALTNTVAEKNRVTEAAYLASIFENKGEQIALFRKVRESLSP
jgi:hypothetical protein